MSGRGPLAHPAFRWLLPLSALGGAILLVGADIVEVAPAYDHAEITGIAAAHVGYELLSVLARNKVAAGSTG